MQQVLDFHEWFFDKPKELPPSRGEHDHRIPLVLGDQAPNTHSYRYSFAKNNEIEKIIKQLYKAGVIFPSTNPYSSLTVMVLEKSDKCCMCPNFRALKKLTLNNKFPIEVVDYFLDELHGAKFVIKLNLCSSYHQIRIKEDDVPKTTF